jgi:hypothetical protein
MDKTTSVIAALRAGKQPSQSQTNAVIEKLLQSELLQVEQTAGGGELSQNGRKLARDLRGILEAYKTYGAHKNRMAPHRLCDCLSNSPLRRKYSPGGPLSPEPSRHLRNFTRRRSPNGFWGGFKRLQICRLIPSHFASDLLGQRHNRGLWRILGLCVLYPFVPRRRCRTRWRKGHSSRRRPAKG